VPTLQIRNASGRWEFLMNGELIAGGKQNRTLRSDMLMGPHAVDWLDLPVYCVEQRRWSAPGRFDSAGAFAPNSVRSGLNQGYDQGTVWRGVEEASKAARVESRTGDVTAIYTDERSKREIDAIARGVIGRIPRRQYVGLVIAHGRTIVSADLFANSALYAKLYEKVIRSHAAEVLWRRWEGAPSVDDARAFLNRAWGASQSRTTAPGGTGTLVTLGGNGIGGQALEYGGQCLHVALFPQIEVPVPMSHPIPGPPRPMPEPMPRER
jgi:hypothetical protein